LQANQDTIITLNYDLVLEKLARDHLSVVLPQETETVPEKRVRVLKLHGSIDWQESGGEVERVPFEKILALEDGAPVIAAPGRSKSATVNSNLDPLWKVAHHALGQAEAVVLVGYSFPQTDAGARMDLLGAIAGGCPGCRTRRIDVVMGPDTAKPEVRRVQSLVEACRNQRRLIDAPADPPEPGPHSADQFLWVVIQPLWAEDFIADYTMRLRDFRCDK